MYNSTHYSGVNALGIPIYYGFVDEEGTCHRWMGMYYEILFYPLLILLFLLFSSWLSLPPSRVFGSLLYVIIFILAASYTLYSILSDYRDCITLNYIIIPSF